MRQFLLVGLCGGYTTFSSFSLQTLALIREGDMMEAGSNVVMSVVFCLVFVWLGAIMAGLINQLRAAG
jgi:CrcB protein